MCADYCHDLALPLQATDSTLGLFLGSTIGNFTPDEVELFLQNARKALGESWFLIGVDPNTDQQTLSKAYGGPLMAALHRNVLDRIARELGGDLSSDSFIHQARIETDPPRVEAHIVAREAARYRIGDQDQVSFAQGESIHTSMSYKYAPEVFQALVAKAGWKPVECWLDDDGLYSLHLLRD